MINKHPTANQMDRETGGAIKKQFNDGVFAPFGLEPILWARGTTIMYTARDAVVFYFIWQSQILILLVTINPRQRQEGAGSTEVMKCFREQTPFDKGLPGH